MKKKSLKNNDEIDIAEIIKNFWDEKIKILIIIIASILIGINYGNRGQELFEGSLEIKPSSNSEFAVFFPINKFFSTESFINDQQNKESFSKKDSFYTDLNSNTILDKFIKDFMKYEQLISVLQKKDYIKEEISKLSRIDQQKKLFTYAQQFTIQVIPKKKINQYFVKFKWHDADEGIEILIETLDLVSKNLAKTVFSDLNTLVNIKKNFIINGDLNRIEYLQEQAEIARELGIDKMSPIGLDTEASFNFNSSTSLNFNSTNLDYYLRGTKAINKEINIIKNRKYKEFTQIENEIVSLKDNTEIKWVDYNLFLIKLKIIKNSNIFLKISIISGFILAFLYVIIYTALKPKKTAIGKEIN